MNIDVTKINRIELIDSNGRSFVRGSIYGTPISVELSVQDNGKTLKVFVNNETK